MEIRDRYKSRRSQTELLHQTINDSMSEVFFNCLKEVYGVAGLSALSVLDVRQPNFRHRAVARLAQAGYLQTIITPNFDCLIELACREIHVASTTHYTMRPKQRPRSKATNSGSSKLPRN